MLETDHEAEAVQLRAMAVKARRLAEVAPEDVRSRLLDYADELDRRADDLQRAPPSQ